MGSSTLESEFRESDVTILIQKVTFAIIKWIL